MSGNTITYLQQVEGVSYDRILELGQNIYEHLQSQFFLLKNSKEEYIYTNDER